MRKAKEGAHRASNRGPALPKICGNAAAQERSIPLPVLATRESARGFEQSRASFESHGVAIDGSPRRQPWVTRTNQTKPRQGRQKRFPNTHAHSQRNSLCLRSGSSVGIRSLVLKMMRVRRLVNVCAMILSPLRGLMHFSQMTHGCRRGLPSDGTPCLPIAPAHSIPPPASAERESARGFGRSRPFIFAVDKSAGWFRVCFADKHGNPPSPK